MSFKIWEWQWQSHYQKEKIERTELYIWLFTTFAADFLARRPHDLNAWERVKDKSVLFYRDFSLGSRRRKG